MNYKSITKLELIRVLEQIKGATFATVTYETPLDMRKTNNPYYGRVTKQKTMNLTLNIDYVKALNKALSKAVGRNVAATEINTRTWGTRRKKTCIIDHKGKNYLSGKINRCFDNSIYLDNVLATDAELDKINEFCTKNKEGKVYVPLINVNFDNLQKITVNKTSYLLKD